jgi:hypothetical protein
MDKGQSKQKGLTAKQQEILSVAPVFSKILEVNGVNWIEAVQSRTQKRYDDLYRQIAGKIDHGFRRARS